MKTDESYCTITEDPRFPNIGIKRFYPSRFTAYRVSREVREKNDNMNIYLVEKTGRYFIGTEKEFKSIHWSYRKKS